MKTRISAAVLLLVLTGATTTACGTPARTPASGAQTDALVPFGRSVPNLTDGQQRRLDRLERRIVDDCLADRGVEAEPVDLPPPAAVSDEMPAWNPYGLLTEDFAAKEGYGVTGPVLRGEPSLREEPARDTGDDEEAYDKALTGTEAHERTVRLPTGESFTVNTDGCQFRAGEELYGRGWDRLMYTYQFLANHVVEDVERAAEVKRARSRWASCMADAGHPVPAGSSAREPVEKRTETAKGEGTGETEALRAAARYELAVARNDARCQQENGLRKAVSDAQRTVEQPLADKHRESLADYARALDKAVRRL
ncbi:hypothetical protein RI138_07580 [Streptomyces sp. C11-1]|uniref:Lipoprotein n=1 Tax=Streptomyces durocortorensis TaxID=2811104 RepID=A0ABY9VVR9_9ACTN|nr:hypothetical protein [Streptomyces durocortorensis]WNF26710.1 hypothetical protein RI138_07580 [Streptomyces durocortorensis]